MEIVDAHTGIVFPAERLPEDYLRPWHRFEERLAVLKEAGVSRALAGRVVTTEQPSFDHQLQENEAILAACAASDGLLIPSATVFPIPGGAACDLLVRCRELGFRFVGEIFDRWRGYQWGTPEYYDVVAAMVRLRMVPLFHCENEVAAEIGQRYPEGKFMIPHLTTHEQRWPEKRLETLAPYPNLYLVTSGTDMFQTGVIKAAVRALGRDRVLYGSDLPVVDPVLGVQAILRSGLSKGDQARVLAGNFNTLLAWTEP